MKTIRTDLNPLFTLFIVSVFFFSHIVAGCSGSPRRNSPSSKVENKPNNSEAPVRKSNTTPQVREPEKKAQAIASPPVTAAATQTNPAVKAPQAPKIQPVKPKPRAIRKRPTQTARMNNSLDDLLLGTSPSMSAQESDSGSSIRGLSPISQTYATSRHIPEQALESLRAMETFQVSPGELKRFLEEGNLRQ